MHTHATADPPSVSEAHTQCNSISFSKVSVQFLSRTQRGLTRGDSRLCHARRHACGCCAMHEVLTECLSETAHQLARSRPLHSLTHECLHRRTTMLESMRFCVTDPNGRVRDAGRRCSTPMMHTTATRTASGQSTQFNDDGEAKDDWHTAHAQCLTPYCSWAYYLTCSSSILAGTRSLPTCKDLVPSINEPTATLDKDEGNAEKGACPTRSLYSLKPSLTLVFKVLPHTHALGSQSRQSMPSCQLPCLLQPR